MTNNNKILLVGWHTSKNYGTALQFYALHKVLSGKFNTYVLGGRSYMTLPQILHHLLLNKGKKQPETDTTLYPDMLYISSRKDKRSVNEQFDTFVVGSDQLWNPYITEDTYFLDFVPTGKNKVSYATSIGFESIPSDKTKRYEKFLKDFRHISVRERAGAEHLAQLLHKNVDVTLDPVFLLDAKQWAEFSKPCNGNLPDKYILQYYVGNNNYTDVNDKLQQYTLPVISLDVTTDTATIDGNKIDVTMQNFVHLVMNASVVCTDSFHATAFALIFHKDIVLLERFAKDEKNNPSVRTQNLLELFNITQQGNTLQVDYNTFENTLQCKRNYSLQWLYNATSTEIHL